MLGPIFFTGGSGLLALNWAWTYRHEVPVVLGMHTRRVVMPSVKVVECALDSVSDILGLLESVSPRLVIHTAGLTDVELCQLNPAGAQYVNVTLAKNVAIACEELKIPLVHISTDHLFDGQSSWTSEKAGVSPLNVYARSKADAEVCIAAVYPDALIVRTNFFGWGMQYRKSFSDKVVSALRAGESISLFGDVFFTPVVTSELARACFDLVSERGTGVVNLVGRERISKFEFGKKLAKVFGLNPSLVLETSIADVAGLAPRPRDMSLSSDRLESIIGWRPADVESQLLLLRRQDEAGMAKELITI